ncbi:hypothetical protein [Streptomyces sp. BRA346]|uniref:hypothetical protein n=1 Tax=Streptomyces sp. BRA346 TaxID=2878199 RepID=UPI00406398A3
MQISKKVALMAAAAAGTIVVGGAGSANAHGLFPQPSGTSQSNSCDTELGLTTTGGLDLAPEGAFDPNSECVNFTNSRAVSQSNECDTTTGITTTGGATLAPTGDIDLGSNCTNIAIADNGVKHVEHHKAKHKAKDPHKAKAKAKHKAKDPHKAKAKAKAKVTKAKVKAKKDCKH